MNEPGFGFSVTPGPPLGVGAEMGRAERMGYDRIGIWDSPALFRAPWPTLASVARDTDRLSIGTWVTNPISRHPLVTASSMATLEDLAPSRTYLGIGSGGTGVWHLGSPAAKLNELAAYISAVRELLATGRSVYNETEVRMEWGRGIRVPILMSAHGPRSLHLAGQIADGVIVGLGVSPDVVEQSIEAISRGAASVGRSIDDLAVWFTCFWFVDPNEGKARSDGAWAATAFALHFSKGKVDGKFVPDKYRQGIVELGNRYDLVAHGRVTDELKAEYVKLADDLGIGEYIRDRFMFAGTPDEVEQQIRAAMGAGAKNFDGAIDADLPEHEERITTWARLVLPRFKMGGN